MISNALYEHQVVLFKGQQAVTPKAQYELTRRFDPASSEYGHGTTNKAAGSILHPDLQTIPHQPQVQVIGNGRVASYEGLTDITLKHPHHRTFHAAPVPAEEDLAVTRFYRWHIDAALFANRQPPLVTTLQAVRVPRGRRQTLRYDDGTGDALDVPLGTTAFASGEAAYDLLTPEQQAFARGTRVEYAPHPYVWMSGARARSDGLGLCSEGRERALDALPAWEARDVQVLPMVWRNPRTGRLALQVHPCAVRKLHLQDGSVVEDLAEVRRRVHELQRPGIAPKQVYAHDWEEGDLVLFHNRGLIHSVVGAFREDEVRIFRQCNLAASHPPLGPEPVAQAA